MSEENSKRTGEKIQNELAQAISKNLNIPVFVISPDLTEKLTEEVRKLPGIEKKYTPEELDNEIGNFLSKMMIVRPKNQEEMNEQLDKFLDSLEIEKNYEAIIILPSVIGLPVGVKVGYLEIVEQNMEDEFFKKHLERQKEKNNLRIDDRSQGKVHFKTYASASVVDVLYKILELPFAILSLILNFDVDPRDCVGIIKSPDVTTTHFLKPEREIRGWSRYSPKVSEKHLEKLSEISVDKKPNRLNQKILQAIYVYGLSRLSRKAEIRFLFLISSFESLLLTENDRDYLGKKISEKTAFLLESDYEKRLELYKLMKNYYGKRSSLVHSGKAKISDSEVRFLEHIFRAVVLKLLELGMSYTKMEQKATSKEQEGVEDYINKLKFS